MSEPITTLYVPLAFWAANVKRYVEPLTSAGAATEIELPDGPVSVTSLAVNVDSSIGSLNVTSIDPTGLFTVPAGTAPVMRGAALSIRKVPTAGAASSLPDKSTTPVPIVIE